MSIEDIAGDINPIYAIGGLLTGFLASIMAGSMMPNSIIMKLIVFLAGTVAGYFVTMRLLNK
jgi:hypothetical protein